MMFNGPETTSGMLKRTLSTMRNKSNGTRKNSTTLITKSSELLKSKKLPEKLLLKLNGKRDNGELKMLSTTTNGLRETTSML